MNEALAVTTSLMILRQDVKATVRGHKIYMT